MRRIPDNNLAYPILLTWDTGATGSGFRVSHNLTIYLVTAKHVLYDDTGNLRGRLLTALCQTAEIDDDSSFLLEIDVNQLVSDKNLFQHPTQDLAGFKESIVTLNEDHSYTPTMVKGIVITRDGTGSTVSTNLDNAVAMFDEVLISNDIFLYGYPSSLGLKSSPQFDYQKPLLRKGIVANKNKASGTIILDCPVYYGNSGGPVVQVELKGVVSEHKVIGVVSQFIPYSEQWKNQSNGLVHIEVSNSGYSVAVAMDFVFEMLQIVK